MKLILILMCLGLSWAGVMDMDSEELDSSEWGVVRGVKSTNCSCGWSNKADKRIIGGRETGINEFPLMAGLMYKSSKIVVCGGAIITAYHVLTAAHCTIPMKANNREMAVVVGEHDLIRRTETAATKIINVKYSIEHEKYHALAHPNDIAILVLEEAVEFTKFVGQACLPTKVFDMSGQYVRVIGWGRTSATGQGSDVLLKVDLRVVPTEECNAKLPVKLPTNIPRQFCTFAKNKDSCKGDSGGPLLWVDPETNRYTLVGLVSFGISCASTSPNSINRPGVNTNVAYYLDWIQAKIQESNPNGFTCSKV